MFCHLYIIKNLLETIDILKREVRRQQIEKEVLEANVREEVISEVMEVVTRMQKDFKYVCFLV